MLSGIGPAEHLAEHGIPVLADRPGVGRNLQDHLELYLQVRSRSPSRLYRHYNWSRSSRSAPAGCSRSRASARQPVRGRPPSCARDRASNIPTSSTTSCRSPVAIRRPRRGPRPRLPGACRPDALALARHRALRERRTRGRRRASASATWPHAKDWSDFRHCVRLTREIFAQPAFAPYAAGRSSRAGGQSDDEIDGFVRENVESAYHPCGTCPPRPPRRPAGGRRPRGAG